MVTGQKNENTAFFVMDRPCHRNFSMFIFGPVILQRDIFLLAEFRLNHFDLRESYFLSVSGSLSIIRSLIILSTVGDQASASYSNIKMKYEMEGCLLKWTNGLFLIWAAHNYLNEWCQSETLSREYKASEGPLKFLAVSRSTTRYLLHKKPFVPDRPAGTWRCWPTFGLAEYAIF